MDSRLAELLVIREKIDDEKKAIAKEYRMELKKVDRQIGQIVHSMNPQTAAARQSV